MVEHQQEKAGRLWTWWRGDDLPGLADLDGFAVEAEADNETVAAAVQMGAGRVRVLRGEGHRAYLARLGEEVVGYGWSASRRASFGDNRFHFHLKAGDRYLWNFATYPDFRGRGIYPRLLQAILQGEPEGSRFWILHRWSNTASARGIAKAGFVEVGELVHAADGSLKLRPHGAGAERAQEGWPVIGIELLTSSSSRWGG